MTALVRVALDSAADVEHTNVEENKKNEDEGPGGSTSPPPDLRLFGVDLTHLSPFGNLVVGTVGVFVCYLVYGILQVQNLECADSRSSLCIDDSSC